MLSGREEMIPYSLTMIVDVPVDVLLGWIPILPSVLSFFPLQSPFFVLVLAVITWRLLKFSTMSSVYLD